MQIIRDAINDTPNTINEASIRVTNIGQFSSKKFDPKPGNVSSYLSKENSLPIDRE